MKLKNLTLIFIIFFITTYSIILIVSFIKPNKQVTTNTTANTTTVVQNVNTNTTPDTTKVPTTQKTTTSNTPPKKAASTNQKPGLRKYTVAEVAKHNTKSDCYLIVNNNVYSVSSYISFHPGGTRNITDVCGKEVTNIFTQIHSNKAWDLLIKYKVGTI